MSRLQFRAAERQRRVEPEEWFVKQTRSVPRVSDGPCFCLSPDDNYNNIITLTVIFLPHNGKKTADLHLQMSLTLPAFNV